MSFGIRLDRLELTNYRRFEHFSIDFDARMTVLVGENGSGKSAVLDAACVALGSFVNPILPGSLRSLSASDVRVCSYDADGVTDVQGQYPVVVAATAEVGEDDGEQVAWENSLRSASDKASVIRMDGVSSVARKCSERIKGGDPDLVLPVIAYYGTGRLCGGRKDASGGSQDFSRQSGYRGALSASANEKQMLDWFYKMTAQDVQRAQSLKPKAGSPLFAAVRGAVERCFEEISGCQKAKVTYNLDVKDLDVEYLDSNGEVHRLPLGLMSDGYRTTLSMFADIAYRLALLNPALGENVLQTPGIILIDEVDLHLHPLWQARILSDLRAVFSNVQFIVTTHAPMVISSVPGRQIRILGETGAHAPSQGYGLGANDVLTGIMGAQDRQPEVRRQLDEFSRCLDEERYDDAERALKDLEDATGPNNPDLVAAHTALAFERL